jgi:hypothetical protein
MTTRRSQQDHPIPRIASGSALRATLTIRKNITLEFVLDRDNNHAAGETEAATSFVKIGLWDNAFDTTSGNLINNRSETSNFIGSDSRRFYFRVKDAEGAAPLRIRWRTSAGSRDDDVPSSQEITLTETRADSHIFVSRAVMLVTDDHDRDQATNSGLSDPSGNRTRSQSDHRTRKITVNLSPRLEGRILAIYRPAAGRPVIASAKLFQRSPEERKKLRVHLVNVRASAGGTATLTTARKNLIIRTFRAIYARCGISVDFNEIMLDPPAACIGWAAAYPGDPRAADPSVTGFSMTGGNLQPSASMTAIINAVRALPGFQANDLYLVYVRYIYSNPVPVPGSGTNLSLDAGGEAFPDSWTGAGSTARGFAFVAVSGGITEFADPHEATHITTNLRNSAGGHFHLGAAGATAPGSIDGRNLMHRFYLPNNLRVRNPKRLWNRAFNNASYSPAMTIPAQVDAIRSSRFVQNL